MVRSDCSSSAVVIAGREVRVPMTRLSLAVLTELEMMSCCTLTSWDSATWASTFRLVRNGDLRSDNEGEIETDQFLQAYKGIEDSTDIQIGVRFICDTCVNDLLACTSVFQLLLTAPVGPTVR